MVEYLKLIGMWFCMNYVDIMVLWQYYRARFGAAK